MGSVPTRAFYTNLATPTERAYHGARTEKEMSDKIPMTSESMYKLIDSMAHEVIKHGENEAKLINNPLLTDEEVFTIMKTNTFLTAYAVLLLKVVEKENPKFAETILNIWMTSPVSDLVKVAFAEEIEEAIDTIAKGIEKLEDIANEGN
jgi:hypothetical protein